MGPGSGWVSFKYDLWDEDAPGPGPSNWMTFRGDDDHCDIVPELCSTIFYSAAGADELAGLVNWSTDGLIYDDGLFSDDGDGNEAAVSFTAGWLEPQRRPFEPTIHSDPNSTTPPRPSAPLVTDSGLWTDSRTYLHATWTVPGGSEYNPVDEYRYQVTRREIALFMGAYYIPVRDWVSAGTTREANINGLSLEEGWVYYIEVQAHNAGGWSETERSNGTALDATPPVLQSLGVAQQTLTRSAPTREQGLGSSLPSGGGLFNEATSAQVTYPNSLAITRGSQVPLPRGGLRTVSGHQRPAFGPPRRGARIRGRAPARWPDLRDPGGCQGLGRERGQHSGRGGRGPLRRPHAAAGAHPRDPGSVGDRLSANRALG